jgi:hypothetical protein
MASWHNSLGENGQRLTILSVLPRVQLSDGNVGADEMSLREAVDELFRIAGEDGQAQVLMLTTSGEGQEYAVSVEEQISLKDLADQLYESFGRDGRSRSKLQILSANDDPLLGLARADVVGGNDGESNGPFAALRRFRESFHRLFGGSAEQGIPPTVLSLLVDPSETSTHTPNIAP